MKLIKPRKLNLTEIHQLYRLLESSLPNKDEEFLIDEIDQILDRIEPNAFMESLSVLYKGNFSKQNDIELLLLFIRGLKENAFFEYAHFINGLKKRG